MPDYTPPLASMLFTLRHLAGYEGSPGFAQADWEMVSAILGEGGKLAAEVLAPLNQIGDRQGARWQDGVVTMPPGFQAAYRAYCAGGWNAVPFPIEHGGQGLPWAVAFAVQEMWQAANMSFGLCPLLNQGAIEAILAHGSETQKAIYLPQLISGAWTGTMNLTEPQAGSDLGAVRTRAVRQEDGSYRLTGQKIFITYGEHDLAENIIHLILARTPDAPAGPKGISLFIVPKILADGTRNDVRCVSVEHKLGIHASPTCTMAFGDAGGAVGELVGQENAGLKYMFTMMNNARLSVGLQGVALAERATQAAIAYAASRVQGNDPLTGGPTAISRHADVQRMLLTMGALTMAARAMAYTAGVMLDRAQANEDGAQVRVDLMTPIVKAWATEIAQMVTSLGVQVHGGMGYVEETGVAQFYRDARILPIYEGTNGIQALDLAGRKIGRDQGAAMQGWIEEMGAAPGVAGSADVEAALTNLRASTDHLVVLGVQGYDAVAARATPYLMQCGYAIGGVIMARALAVPDVSVDSASLARFYLSQILPMASAHHVQVMADVAF